MKKSKAAQNEASRILRRAIEVDEERPGSTLDGELDTKRVAQVAAEVGVASESVAVAIAESKVGAIEAPSLLDRLVGPRRVSATRPVDANEEDTRARLIEWLTVAHGLKPWVNADGLVVAKKRDDIAGKLTTGIRRLQGLGALSNANSVTAAAYRPENELDAADEGIPGVVCAVVDMSSKRNEALAGGVATSVGLAAVVAGFVVVTGPFALIGLPISLSAGTIVARKAHGSTINKIASSLDHTVDGIAQDIEPPRPAGSNILKRRFGGTK